MHARFAAKGVIRIPSTGLIGLYGAMLEGDPRVGQIATTLDGFRARVHGVEFVRLNPREEYLALTFLAPDPGSEAALIGLELAGGEVSLLEPHSFGTLRRAAS